MPDHFKAHGISGMERKVIIQCHWDDCQHYVTRHNFVRHIRDIHLRPFVFLCRVPCQTLITLPFTFGRFIQAMEAATPSLGLVTQGEIGG